MLKKTFATKLTKEHLWLGLLGYKKKSNHSNGIKAPDFDQIVDLPRESLTLKS